MTVGSWFVTGSHVRHIIDETFRDGCFIGLDIETAGVDYPFDVKCVTATWNISDLSYPGAYVSVLLDPNVPDQAAMVREITDRAGLIVLHNAMFDTAPLWNYELLSTESIDKIWDTLVLARMRFTSDLGGRKLRELVTHYTSMSNEGDDMKEVFAAAGMNNNTGWMEMGVETPAYRRGAMLDTLATLVLFKVIYDDIIAYYSREEYKKNPGAFNAEQYAAKVKTLIGREQVTNRVMLRRSAFGMAIDTEYLNEYSESVRADVREAEQAIRDLGLDPDSGTASYDIVVYLNERGELPEDWPTTKTGKLSASKKHFESLDHPIVKKVTALRYARRVIHYLEKVSEMAELTGRLHPKANVLGASATGRMSYSDPEIQQFPDEARPIFVPDEGRKWVSIDWSSIEPVVIANVTGDDAFLSAFDRGEDLYVPLGRAIGLIPPDISDEEALKHKGRKLLKVVMLATMYGQGVSSTAAGLGIPDDEVFDIRNRIFSQLPNTKEKLDSLKNEGNRNGMACTVDGRYLTVEKNSDYDANDPRSTPYRGYKAMNYYVQGSAYSLLSEVINELERRGLGWGIQFAMHDELVVDSEIAVETQQIMETAPQWLAEASGGSAKLKTDMNPLWEEDENGNVINNHWMSV